MPKTSKTALRGAQSRFSAKKRRWTAAPVHSSRPIRRPGPCNAPPRTRAVDTSAGRSKARPVEPQNHANPQSRAKARKAMRKVMRRAAWKPLFVRAGRKKIKGRREAHCVNARLSPAARRRQFCAGPSPPRIRDAAVSAPAQRPMRATRSDLMFYPVAKRPSDRRENRPGTGRNSVQREQAGSGGNGPACPARKRAAAPAENGHFPPLPSAIRGAGSNVLPCCKMPVRQERKSNQNMEAAVPGGCGRLPPRRRTGRRMRSASKIGICAVAAFSVP